MKYMEYKELKVPEEIIKKLEESAQRASQDPSVEVMTFGEAGVFDWLNKLSKEEGWCAVWEGFRFPYVVLEREQFTEN